MELTIEQMANLKKVETEMLAAFVDVCKKLELRYYLLGGTLLGAVRHKGFIPWDDDIDVGMPRRDYEVFMKKGQQFMPQYYFVQNIFTDPEYLMAFAKIRDSRTTFIETSINTRKINHGVYIDVFPLDYYPEGKQKQKRFILRKKLYNLRIASFLNIPRDSRFTKQIRRMLVSVLYPSCKSVLHKRDRLFKSVPESSWIANHSGAWGEKEIVPKEWYAEGVELQFEGLHVMAPVAYDKWLKQVYGDYMKLPPEEKRVPHHYVDVIDLSRPYTDYMEGM